MNLPIMRASTSKCRNCARNTAPIAKQGEMGAASTEPSPSPYSRAFISKIMGD